MTLITANVHRTADDGPHPVKVTNHGDKPRFATIDISGVAFFVADLAEAADLATRLTEAVTDAMTEAMAE